MGIFSEIDMENKIKKEQEEAAVMDSALDESDDEAQEEGNSPLETINPPSEDEKRKAHEEAEAKRKAEWEAKKKEREEADTMAWEEAIDMDDNSLMKASSERLAADTERITRRNMKDCVTKFLSDRCYEDLTFAQLVMHPRKSMIRCFKYINRKAMEYVKQEMEDNGIEPSRDGYGCDVPDDLCYQWAVEYFSDMEAPEDKKEGEEDFVPKPYTGSATKKTTKSKTEKKTERPKKAEAKPAVSMTADPKPAAVQSEGQLSIFNMGVA